MLYVKSAKQIITIITFLTIITMTGLFFALSVGAEDKGLITFHTDNLDGELTQSEVNEQLTAFGVGNEDTFSAAFDETVKSIGVQAFYSNLSLTSVMIGDNVISIGDSAFRSCYYLTNLDLGNSVVSIGDAAFNITGITGIVIPDSTTSIGSSAFDFCNSLTNIYIPENVGNIGKMAFGGCANLTEINVSQDNECYSSQDGVLYDINKSILMSCPAGKSGTFTIPDGVESIDYGAFISCSNLVNVYITNSVTRIGAHAFEGCISFTGVEIPENVTVIEYAAFYGCTSILKVSIGKGLIELGQNVFGGCESLTEIIFHPDNSAFAFIDGIVCNKDLTKLIACLPGKRGGLLMSNSVVSIGDYAFYNCTGLLGIEIPNTVTNIGELAFCGCSSLTNIVIPDSVTHIANSTFAYCSNLTNITIPGSVELIGASAFSDCSSLTNVVIPDSVTHIANYAFANCSALENITIPNSVNNIGLGVFSNTAIQTVTLPPSVKAFGGDNYLGSFQSMPELENIVFEQGSTSIENYAFFGITNQIKVFVPKSVTYISDLSGLGANTTICGFEESYAEQYAVKNNIPFETIPTILPETDMPPDGYLYLPYSFKFKSSEGSWLEVVDGVLPKGLEISLDADDKRQLGEIFGAPLESGEFSVTVRVTDGNIYPFEDEEVAFKIYILDQLTQDRLDEINDGRLLIPLGEPASDGVYIVEIYDTDPEDLDIKFANDYIDFIDLWINGEQKVKNKDYSVRNGSTVITVFAQTFDDLAKQKDTTNVNVIAGEFKVGGKADGEQSKVAQNFKLLIVERPNTDTEDDKYDDTGEGKGDDKGEGDDKGDDKGDNKGDSNTITDPGSKGSGVNRSSSSGSEPEDPPTEQPTELILEEIPESAPEETTFAGVFIDVKATDWFFYDVEWVYKENIMIGVSKTSFAPYVLVTPAMISVTLARMIDIDLSTSDSGADSWYSKAFTWACDMGLFGGISELSYDMPFDRGRLAVALARLVSNAGLDASVVERDEGATASDVEQRYVEEQGTDEEDDVATVSDAILTHEEGFDSTDDYINATGAGLMSVAAPDENIDEFISVDAELMSVEELNAFRLLYNLGIIKGRGNGVMDPRSIPVRAELAAILQRLDQYITDLRIVFHSSQDMGS